MYILKQSVDVVIYFYLEVFEYIKNFIVEKFYILEILPYLYNHQ